MTDETQTKSELDVLKDRARMLGISFSNNIKLETLRQKVSDAQDGITSDDTAEDADEDQAAEQSEVNPLADTDAAPKNETPGQRRLRLIQESMKLVRIRVTCMDPKKKDMHGEFFTTGNGTIGTVRKFVPFGEATDNGYHVPKIIYDLMKEREFLHIRTVRNKKTGTMDVKTKMVKEFAIEVLPQLTEEELADLARTQAASGSLRDDD